jgi:hypothetical protein
VIAFSGRVSICKTFQEEVKSTQMVKVNGVFKLAKYEAYVQSDWRENRVNNREDTTMMNTFCLGTYVAVDDICGQLALFFKQPGPPRRRDSELITMAVAGECRDRGIETEIVGEWRAHRDLLLRAPLHGRCSRQPAA